GYFSSIGVVSPFKDDRILHNHLNYSSSCHFNNVYIYVVPRIEQKFSTTSRLSYVNTSLKQLILQSLKDKMEISLNPVIQDPVFIAVDVGVSNSDPKLDDLNSSTIEIIRSGSTNNKKFIKDAIKDI